MIALADEFSGLVSSFQIARNEITFRCTMLSTGVKSIMGRIVIVAFKPKPGKDAELAAVVEKHWGILKREGLVTDRPRYTMQAKDGTILEVFEWLSPEAIQKAHHNPAVLALWTEFEAACDYGPLASLPESLNLFAEFQPLPI